MQDPILLEIESITGCTTYNEFAHGYEDAQILADGLTRYILKAERRAFAKSGELIIDLSEDELAQRALEEQRLSLPTFDEMDLEGGEA